MSAVSVSESGVRPVLADAAEVARRALVELEPEGVGEHLGVTAEDETAATHRFATTLAGYRGWQWAVVVAAPPEAEYATVSESALLPGPDALIAPDFIPWEQRVRPGDLGPGDLLAPPADDPRLVPGYVATGDPVVDEVAREVGFGRTQVLSLEGRVEAAQRWYTEFGPDTEMAKAAPSTCGLCGFYLPLAGALRESFGVCGNAMGADGHVVHIEYGCGAHSDVVAPSGNGSPRYEAFDDHAVDIVEVVRANGASEGVPSAELGNAPADTAASAESATADAADQETAEAEAADAAAADRAALAEGATPESADEVVAAEQAPESAPTAESAPTGPADTESGDVRSSAEPVVAEAAASAAAAPATAAAGDDQVGESPSAAEIAASVAIEVEVPPASGPATEALSEPIAADTAAEGTAELAAADAVAEVPAEPIAGEASAEPTANVGTQASDESASAAKSAADDAAQPGGDSVAQAAADAAGALAAAAAGDAQTIDETASAADGVAGIAAAAAVEVPPASGPAGAEGEAGAGESVDEHGSSVAR